MLTSIIWTLSSNILPLISALILIPILIQEYGLVNFGLITLIWAITGFFGIFDFGLSRALTQLISKSSNNKTLLKIINTGFYFSLFASLIITLVVYVCLEIFMLLNEAFVLTKNIKIVEDFKLISLIIPLTIHSSSLRGILEGLKLFGWTSIARSTLGIGLFLFPFMGSLFFVADFKNAVLSIFILRIIIWFIYFIFCYKSKFLKLGFNFFSRIWFNKIFHTGIWMFVSNFIGPVILYIDKFIIAAFLGAGLLTYYSAPYEILTKILVIPFSIGTVLFPFFSGLKKNNHRDNELLKESILISYIIIFPILILTSYLSPILLKYWIGGSLDIRETNLIVYSLIIGIWFNNTSFSLFTYIQSKGFAKYTAYLHLIELAPFILILIILISKYGIIGAGLAWVFRHIFDLVGLTYISKKINPLIYKKFNSIIFCFIFTILILILPYFIDNFFYRIQISFFTLIIYAIFLYKNKNLILKFYFK